MKKSLPITALAIFSLVAGFYYGINYNQLQMAEMRQSLKTTEIALYVCETGINPKDKLDMDPTVLSSKTGEVIFKANCAVCHGAKAEGYIGPNIKDSDLELLKLKVTKGQYPEGYKPKRGSRSMPRFPHLDSKIEDLHEYLNSL